MKKTITTDTLLLGLEYARAGQIISIAIAPGEVRGEIQGRRSRPYAVRVAWQPFAQEQWQTIVAAMADEAIYAAKILAGELPDTAADLFTSHGLSLVPTDSPDIAAKCTCGFEGVCKHAAALAYLLVERLEGDPLQVFTLRGLPADRLLERLREARTIRSGGASSAHALGGSGDFAGLPMAAPPLEECIEQFWQSGASLESIAHAPPPQHVSHALLRRLGPSPLQGRFPMSGLLASIYDAVAEAAIHLRDRAEHIEIDDVQ